VPHPYGQDERSGGVIEPALDASASAPFDALLHAVQTHDRAALTAALSPHARLSVPPLRIHVEGAQDVATTIADVAYAFDYLRYTMRSRYLAPGQVTDEAELSGVHARDLLGAPPTGRASTVVMRVIAAVEAGQVSELAIWPDVAAVRGICDELARHIDERQAGAAGAMITALRATIPAGSTKVLQGRAREAREPSVEPVAAAVLPPAQRTPSKASGLKVPLTRRARRRRAVVAGGTMLAISAGIVAWVTHGALQSPGGGTALTSLNPLPSASSSAGAVATRSPSPVSATPSVSVGSTAGGSLGSSPTPSPSPSTTPKPVTIVNNQVEFSADLLFETGSAKLAQGAMAELDLLIRKVIMEHRDGGPILVSGYTDDQGPSDYNLLLSRNRAKAVADVLSAGLPTVTIRSQGFGEAHPKYTNKTAKGMAQNRRVTVKVSPPKLPTR